MFELEMKIGYAEICESYDHKMLSGITCSNGEYNKSYETANREYFNEEKRSWEVIGSSDQLPENFFNEIKINCAVINRRFVRNLGVFLENTRAKFVSELEKRKEMYASALEKFAVGCNAEIMKLV